MSIFSKKPPEYLSTKPDFGKVTRYWPGRVPKYAAGAEEEEKEAEIQDDYSRGGRWDNQKKVDRRLQRVAESRRDRDVSVRQHREIRHAEIVSADEEEDEPQSADERANRDEGEGSQDEEQQEREREASRARARPTAPAEADEEEDEDDEEARERRRQRIREKLMQRKAVEPEPEEDDQEEEEEESEEESEYETEEEEDDEPGIRAMLKPVFVPKTERETIAERERLEQEEAAAEELKKIKLEERKKETRQLVEQELKNDELRDGQVKTRLEDVPDDNDEEHQAEEYEAWKVRELKRIKRDREEREKWEREQAETERRRNMTDAERREEDKQVRPQPQPRRKWNFLQKYYHKGAFFLQEEETKDDSVYNRDYSMPTGEDKMDKSILPKVMQVKHFGRSGRTKYTHLVDQDTTEWNSPWTFNDALRVKYNQKLGGVGAIIDRPALKKQRTS